MNILLILLGVSEGKESTCNAVGSRFNPWVRKIPMEKEMGSTPVVLPGGLIFTLLISLSKKDSKALLTAKLVRLLFSPENDIKRKKD